MFSAMLVWSVLGAPVPDFRDKLGTTFFDNWPRSAESALFIGFDKAGKNQAERAGFLLISCIIFHKSLLENNLRIFSLLYLKR